MGKNAKNVLSENLYSCIFKFYNFLYGVQKPPHKCLFSQIDGTFLLPLFLFFVLVGDALGSLLPLVSQTPIAECSLLPLCWQHLATWEMLKKNKNKTTIRSPQFVFFLPNDRNLIRVQSQILKASSETKCNPKLLNYRLDSGFSFLAFEGFLN